MVAPAEAGLGIFARNVVGTFLRIVATVGLGLLTTVVLARVLGPEGNGRYALAILLPTVLVQLMNLGVSAANVYYVGGGRVSLDAARRGTWRLFWVVGAVGVAVGGLCIALQAEAWFSGVPAKLLWLALLAFAPGLWFILGSGLLQAREDFSALNRAVFTRAVVALGAVIVLVWALPFGAAGAVVGHFASQLAGVVAVAIGLRTHLAGTAPEREGAAAPEPPDDEGYVRRALAYGWKAHFSNMLSFLNYRADLFLLNLLAGTSEVGIYVVAVAIAERVWLLSQAVSTVLLPRLAEQHAQGIRTAVTTPLVARWVFWISATGGAGLCLVVPLLVPLLFGPRYTDVSPALIYLMPGIVLGSLARVLANDLAARGRPELNMYVALVVVVTNVAANVALIPGWGIRGAAMATSLAYGLNASIKVVLYARVAGERWASALVLTRGDWVLLRRLVARTLGRRLP